jgi:hypothetical protein
MELTIYIKKARIEDIPIMGDDDKNKENQQQRLLEATLIFKVLALDAELGVIRTILVRQPGVKKGAERQIDEIVANRINKRLSEFADDSPVYASFFSELLKKWKHDRGI